MIIECVGPAKDDPFVNHHLNTFCQKTRFCRSDCILDLQEVWPSRRNRWWCILAAPAIGKIPFSTCPGLPDLKTVEHVLPKIPRWPIFEEKDLQLSPVELEAFRAGDFSGKSYILNKKGQMACALHCWGSQLGPCPCGCRTTGLSPTRLEAKGLFGVLIESEVTGATRHIHPQEASALCGLDPNLKWGPDSRLALGAVGQLASPVQAVWVFSHAMKHLQLAQFQKTSVDPAKTLMAYRTWLLARCRNLLSGTDARFPASETLAHVGIFEKHAHLTLTDLLGTLGPEVRDKTIQACWEIFSHQMASGVQLPANSLADPTGGISDRVAFTPTSEVSSVHVSDDSEAPLSLTVSQIAIDGLDSEWSEEVIEDHIIPVPVVDAPPLEFAVPKDGFVCLQTVHQGVVDEPVEFRFTGHPSVDTLQTAECCIRGLKRKADHVFENGLEVSPTHELCVGSTYLLDFGCEPHLHGSHDCSLAPKLDSFSSDVEVAQAEHESEVTHDASDRLPVPSIVSFGPHAASGVRFLDLQVPVVTSVEHAQSLLGQRSSIESRLQLLNQQEGVWGDDEIRWHLSRLQSICGESQSVFVLEPLVVFGCFQTQDFRPVARWVASNHRMNSVFITVALQNQHWYPVFLKIGWEGVKAMTWDIPGVSHCGLDSFVHSVAGAIGLDVHSVIQHNRSFSGSTLCGALSIAFLEHHLCKTPLPETKQLAETQHAYLRELFQVAVSEASITWLPWIWGAGVGDHDFEKAVELLQPMLVSHGVPSDNAHHRARQAVKAIGVVDVTKACNGSSPWKTLKTLGTNVKFQFVTPDELKTQIEKRAGNGPVGKPKKSKQSKISESPTPVALDPSKLCLPDGAFTGGGKSLSQLPLTMLGPLAEGIVIVTYQQAEPFLRAAQTIATGPLALLILQGPIGDCPTSLCTSQVTVPARCLVNQEPLLLEATLVQLGTVQVEKSKIASPVEIDTVQVATIKITVFRDEATESWEIVSGAPLKYIIKSIPLFRLCRGDHCVCPCWHNNEKINTSDAIIDVWRRQFLRAGYKPEPVSTAVMFSVCVRIPQCLLARVLSCSGEGGVYIEPRSMDSKGVSAEFEVIWVPKTDKATISHLRQINPAAAGIARLGDRFGLRTSKAQAADLHKVLRPEAVYLSTGVRQQYLVGPIPYGTDRKALSRALALLPWAVKPLQPIASIDSQRGVMWSVLSVEEPPMNIVNMSHGEVVITKQKDQQIPKQHPKQSVATPSTLSLCGSDVQRGPDPWAKQDPWSSYRISKSSDGVASGLVTATESMSQLEQKIEQAVLSKIPQTFAMDQDDMPDKIQELESKFQTLVTRQQQLEGLVQEQFAQTSVQFGQMQAQLKAQGQQISGHMETQQLQIQQMFDSQMSQIRSLLSKRKCDSEHE